jgi:Mce-associated membrane protein
MADNAAAAGQLTAPHPDDGIADIEDFVEPLAEADADDANDAPTPPWKVPTSPVRAATLLSLAVVVALATLVGWLGFRGYQSHQAQAQRSQFLQVARQGALNLTTIDWQKADSDVQRILDGATGEFHDDFAKRSQPFIDVVKQAKSTTVGTITEAGLESATGGAAQVLVAVAVKTSNAGEPEAVPRAWRMRISVQKVGDQAIVSNVEFVA